MSQTQELSPRSEENTSPGASGGAVQNPSTSLYVGDLEESVTDSQLFEVFCEVGQVVSVRVCRDVSSRKSLGYAYVNFNEASDAAKALEALNFTPINGKPIRVMHSNRDPSSRQINEANLFVKNLDKSVTNLLLYKTFSPYGHILSCKVATDLTAQSKGYGFVQFDSVESAKNAIKSLNGTALDGKRIFVGPFVAKEDRESTSNPSGSNKFNNVFVKNLSEPTTENDLIDIFGKFGKITSAIVMREGDGKSKCFGFVNFENPDDAATAVEDLNRKIFDGKEWFVGKAMKKSEREREREMKRSERGMPEGNATYINQNQNHRSNHNQLNNNLYLKNLEENVTDDDLKELFSAFGTVMSAKVMREPNGHSRGVGFVAFESQNNASRALGEMNGKLIRNRPLYVAFAQRKEDRRARLQDQYAMMPQMPMAPHPVGPRMPMYPHNMGQPMFFAPPPPFIPPQAGYGFQQPIVPGMRGGPMPPFMPMVPQGQRGPRARRVPHKAGHQWGPLPIASSAPNQMVGGGANGNMQGSLASALAKSTPDQQRIILGERLFPLVAELEHEMAAKITGMLLEMDRDEILHLLESPDELKLKVEEAVRVLRSVVHSHMPSDQFNSLSLDEHSDRLASLSLSEGVV
ncbi:polyadenylate-binding protein 2-like isoform X2 [Carex rostrata]